MKFIDLVVCASGAPRKNNDTEFGNSLKIANWVCVCVFLNHFRDEMCR